jgi:hypothetical protein
VRAVSYATTDALRATAEISDDLTGQEAIVCFFSHG